MFIYNLKINGNKVFRYFLACSVILIVIIVIIVSFKVFKGANNSSNNLRCTPQNDISKISSSNYTNVLKTVHENIDNYIGKKIRFTGYIYRTIDLQDNQFVLARDMIISSNFQSVIVGFLCECSNANNFENNTWVDVTGEITKGDYHGEMPIIKVLEINNTDKPNDEFVYPPDESYIPTQGIL